MGSGRRAGRMAWEVARESTNVCFLTCSGPPEASHRASRAMGRKSSDSETWPFCRAHARQWDGNCGLFKHFVKADRRAFEDKAIEDTKRRLQPTGGSNEPK